MALRTAADSEWVTRKEFVDKELRAAGWRVTPYTAKALSAFERCAIEEYPTQNGPADYALILGGQVVGIVEAKKLTLGPQNVLSQAERYCRGVHEAAWSCGEFGVPFLYSTNGEVIWHHDVRDDRNRSRQIAYFHTPEALAEQLGRDHAAAEERMLSLPQNNPRLRPYQGDASSAIEQALASRKRQMLVAMTMASSVSPA